MVLSWFQLALLVAVGFATQTILCKFIMNRGVSPLLLVTLVFTVSSIVMLAYSFYMKEFTAITTDIVAMIIIASLITAVANILSFRAVSIADNPGYPGAVWTSSIVIITLASLFVFKLPFDFIKIIGIILVFIGVVMISGIVKI